METLAPNSNRTSQTAIRLLRSIGRYGLTFRFRGRLHERQFKGARGQVFGFDRENS